MGGEGATNQLPSSENLCKLVANCWRLYMLCVPETIHKFNFLGCISCVSWIIFGKVEILSTFSFEKLKHFWKNKDG